MKINDKKTINAWCSYDLANSVYNLIITTAIFPIYYTNATEAAFGGSTVKFFGLSIDNSVLYSYAISFSFLISVIFYLTLSGIADYRGSKKAFMRLFTYLGSFSCISLYFFTGANIELGIALAILASVGYASSVVFYNGFLPEIVTEDKFDSVSAKGFSMGYIGSVFLLVICLVLVSVPETFGFIDSNGEPSAGAATQFSFLLVGLWWFGFSHIAFKALQDKPTGNPINKEAINKGFNELKSVLNQIKDQPIIKNFLSSFFFYSMGVQTVMLLAPLFAASEVGMESSELIIVILLIQLVAIGGATLFAKVAEKKGIKLSISVMVIIWMGICVASFLIKDKVPFYIMAGVLGLVMGGIQSVSRSTYAKFIPKNTMDNASYFSFYDVSEKVAIVLGTFSYGLIDQISGSMRNSVLIMGLFFVIALIILQLTKMKPTKD
ncbi:MFS transporter [Reichenbachiella versicolor]|uniref:MFS transporter n=1 Tax=Reichenbachiella versicolor TaxID=1821036 RepID=UPI000D6E088A|nr:MFS transporter [Reichenbachiella versicolor]